MEPLLVNLFLRTLPGNLVLRTLLGNLFPGPLLGNLGTWLGNFPGNLACEPVPGKFDWKSCSWGGCRPQAYVRLGKNVPKQVSKKRLPSKRFPSKAKFLGTACKYGSQKRFPSKVHGTVSKQSSKQEQASQEQVLKQAFPERAGSPAKFPGASVPRETCLRTSF